MKYLQSPVVSLQHYTDLVEAKPKDVMYGYVTRSLGWSYYLELRARMHRPHLAVFSLLDIHFDLSFHLAYHA